MEENATGQSSTTNREPRKPFPSSLFCRSWGEQRGGVVRGLEQAVFKQKGEHSVVVSEGHPFRFVLSLW